MKEPKVSYIVPSYNHCDYINKTIESIASQTYDNIQIIIIDDNSQDGTRELLEKYKNINNITIIYNEENQGIAKNLNTALEVVEGEFLGICASDDWIPPNKVEHQVKYLLENNYDAVVSNCMKYMSSSKIYKPGQSKSYRKKLHKIFRYGSEEYLKYIYESDEHDLLLQSGLFRAECVRNIKWLEEYKSDDWLFSIRFLQAGYSIGYIDEIGVFYRIHEGNTHSNTSYCLNELEIPVIDSFIPREYKKRAYSNVFATAARKELLNNNYSNAISYWKKSLWERTFGEQLIKDIKVLLVWMRRRIL